jgi:hypothetical protein
MTFRFEFSGKRESFLLEFSSILGKTFKLIRNPLFRYPVYEKILQNERCQPSSFRNLCPDLESSENWILLKNFYEFYRV